jgi:hypothetical protein
MKSITQKKLRHHINTKKASSNITATTSAAVASTTSKLQNSDVVKSAQRNTAYDEEVPRSAHMKQMVVREDGQQRGKVGELQERMNALPFSTLLSSTISLAK